MLWKDIVYPSRKSQELYRLALCICGGIILLGSWRSIGYHPGLLGALLLLFLYQFSSYFTTNKNLPQTTRQRLSTSLELADALITGILVALVAFDAVAIIGIGLIFLLTVSSARSSTSAVDIATAIVGALLASWLVPEGLLAKPETVVQVLLLLVGAGYCLLHATTARQTYLLLSEQYDSIRRQNEWLTLRTFRLSKYLSPALRKAILTGKDVRAETQEKTLTIFFSDMAGFTNLAEKLDAEQLTSFLNVYLTEMSEIAFRFGGTIDKVIGDAIMVFFGDPESRGIRSDAVTCVSMAIAMRKRMEHLCDRWRAEGFEDPPALRMGINTGICKVGNFGTENRLDYTLLGREVNLASRLESAADSNEILISHETYELIKEAVQCIDKGTISVKGFADPISVYSVTDLHKHLNSDHLTKREALA